MNKIILLIISINLTACASYWDRLDACQTRAELGRPAGYQAPSYCGAGSGGTVYVTRDFRTNNIITTTRSSK
jgi:hypothetical protein